MCKLYLNRQLSKLTKYAMLTFDSSKFIINYIIDGKNEVLIFEKKDVYPTTTW